MEHGIILLIHAILAIDGKLQKPLADVMPELPQLRRHPERTLTDTEIIVGPRKAYAASSLVGALIACIVLVVFIVQAFDRPKNQRVEPWYLVAAGLSALVSGAAATALMVRWLRGGSAILRGEGVSFHHRGKTVFCPWELFQSAGMPYQPDERRVIVPANDSTPVVVVDIEGRIVAQPADRVKTKPLAGCKDGQVALADLYEVRLADFAELLLFLGRQLGDGMSAGDAADPKVKSPRLAVAEAKNWIRLRLTKLPFPPVCLGCGSYSHDSIEHTIGTSHQIKLSIPLCRTCQQVRRRRRFGAAILGLALGIAPPILAGLIGLATRDVELAAILVVVSLPIGVLAGVISFLVARDRADPMRFSDYSMEAGTIAMRLRPPPGPLGFRRAIGLSDESNTGQME